MTVRVIMKEKENITIIMTMKIEGDLEEGEGEEVVGVIEVEEVGMITTEAEEVIIVENG